MSLRPPDWLIEQRRKAYYEMHNMPYTPPSETPDKPAPIRISEAMMLPPPLLRVPVCLHDLAHALGREEYSWKTESEDADAWKRRLNLRMLRLCELINTVLYYAKQPFTVQFSNIADAVHNPDSSIGTITVRKNP